MEDPAVRGAVRALVFAEGTFRAQLVEADEDAMTVFGGNLRNLLLQPPLRGQGVLGLDPGYRTGCKVAVVDGNGNYVESSTIFPHPPVQRWSEAKTALKALIAKHAVGVIAIGNGTASRETEQLAAEVIGDLEQPGPAPGTLAYGVVTTAGRRVFSPYAVA